LIETRSLTIYVGIVTQQFTEDGRDVIGISTEAPIYRTLYNQTVNFSFQFAGVDCEILSIQ
jgi:stringent starvation protein B